MGKNTESVVYEKLKNAIIKRYIKQGSKLVEETVASQLGVSRTPVRGAIKRLVYEGFADYTLNKGAFVKRPLITDIEQTFDVRVQLEKMAARLAAQYITELQLEELNQYLEKEKGIFGSKDLEQYFTINDAIHLKIVEASKNHVLLHYVKELLERTKIYLILLDPFSKMTLDFSVVGHQHVVQALKKKDPALSEQMMENHFQNALDGIDTKDLLPDDYLDL